MKKKKKIEKKKKYNLNESSSPYLKPIPKFKDEDEEFEFWSNNDSTEYLDWSKAKKVIFPNLKFTTRNISIRLPEMLIYRLKQIANSKDVPYQSLIKIMLSDAVAKELKK